MDSVLSLLGTYAQTGTSNGAEVRGLQRKESTHHLNSCMMFSS